MIEIADEHKQNKAWDDLKDCNCVPLFPFEFFLFLFDDDEHIKGSGQNEKAELNSKLFVSIEHKRETSSETRDKAIDSWLALVYPPQVAK